jgi:hypothetical protein
MAFDTDLESVLTCEVTGDIHTPTIGKALTASPP